MTVRDADRLVALKPTKVKNEVKAEFSHKEGKVMVDSTRFRTRVMRTAGHQVYTPFYWNKEIPLNHITTDCRDRNVFRWKALHSYRSDYQCQWPQSNHLSADCLPWNKHSFGNDARQRGSYICRGDAERCYHESPAAYW